MACRGHLQMGQDQGAVSVAEKRAALGRITGRALIVVMVVEKGQPVGVPTKLRCIHWLACLTDADAASALPLSATVQSMTGKEVRFRDEDGRPWVVTLR